MRRLSFAYAKSKLLHGYLRLSARPPAALFGLPGYLHPLEGRFLFWLARRVPSQGRVVEIGSFKGKSSSFLAAGLAPGARLACVDTWWNDAMPDERADVLPEFLGNTEPYASRIDVHRADSTGVASRWRSPVDLLFIDGDHSYEACRADIEAWKPFLKIGGWIAFHDSGQTGVARAIADSSLRLAAGSRLQAWSILAGRMAR